MARIAIIVVGIGLLSTVLWAFRKLVTKASRPARPSTLAATNEDVEYSAVSVADPSYHIPPAATESTDSSGLGDVRATEGCQPRHLDPRSNADPPVAGMAEAASEGRHRDQC